MPRCLVKHCLPPVHAVFCTLSAYFSCVFLSECLWNALSSQARAAALLEHVLSVSLLCHTSPGLGEHPAGWRGQRSPTPGTSQKSCSSGAQLQSPGTDSRAPGSPSSHTRLPGHSRTQRKVGTGKFFSHPPLVLPLLWGLGWLESFAPFAQLAPEFS